jgi:hypothetical protein
MSFESTLRPQNMNKGLEQGNVVPLHAVAQLVEALRYKLEGRGFDSRYNWNFSLP